MVKGRCVYCGEEILLFQECKSCKMISNFKLAKDFINIPDEVSKSIKDLREKMLDGYYYNLDVSNFAREIIDLINNDPISNYLLAKYKKNEFFINKFFLELDKELLTKNDAIFIGLDLLKGTVKDLNKVLDYLKILAIDNELLLFFMDKLEDKLKSIKNNLRVVDVIFDFSDYKTYKILKSKLENAGFIIGFSNLKIIVTSKNVLSNYYFNSQVRTLKNLFLELKLNDFTHDVFLNQYIGIEDFVLVKESLDEAIDELIELIKKIDDNNFLIKDIKKDLRQKNEAYFKHLEEIKKAEELRLIELERQRKEEEERLEQLELLKKLEMSQLEAKKRDEEERLDRMEQFIFESYNSNKIIKQVVSNTYEDITKQIKKVKSLIEIDELLQAIDLAYELLENNPRDYRVHFLVARLESDNFKDILNKTHIKYFEQAMALADIEEKQEMLNEYMPYSNLREKALVLNSLQNCLNLRITNVQKAIKYYNEAIKYYKANDVLKAIELWKISSDYESAEASYCLAYQYISGKVIEKNITKAMCMLHKASKKGHDKSSLMLAEAYEKGLFDIEKDPEAACYFYSIIKDKQDLIPQLKVLAEEYNKKSIIDPILKNVALKYYEILADLGDVQAMLKAASLHAYGIGSFYDRSKTVYYYKKAASLKNEEGMYKYALILKSGLYESKKDEAKYVELIEQLADTHRDNLEYQKKYIELYEFGLCGVAKSEKFVVKLYEDLARINPLEEYYKLKLAEIYLNGLLGTVKDEIKAINLYNEITLNNPKCEEAQVKLAEVYEQGLYNVKKDLSKVGKIYSILVSNYPTNTTYINKLANLFKKSSGKNGVKTAMKYYQISYELGSIEAAYNLCYSNLTGENEFENINYQKVIEIANEVLKKDPKSLNNDEEFYYFKIYQIFLVVYANGGYGVNKDEELAKEHLRKYNEIAKNKLKYKDLAL